MILRILACDVTCKTTLVEGYNAPLEPIQLTLNIAHMYYNHFNPIKMGPKNSKKGTRGGPNFEQNGDQKGTFKT